MPADLLSYVTASDSLKVSRVAFNYAIDPAVVSPGTVTRYDICPAKPKGKLLFDIDLAKFGIQDVDFHVTAVGVASGTDTTGAPVIRWTIDEAVGIYLPALDVTLESIKGGFSTSIHPIAPAAKAQSCDGVDRFYAALLMTTGSDNGLVLSVTKDVAGIAQYGKATASEFSLEAVVGEPLSLGVRISIPSTPCSRPVVAGGQCEAFAITSGIPLNVGERYSWRLNGGVPIGPTNQWKLSFTTPTLAPVSVSVEVSAADQLAHDTVIVRPISPQQLEILNILCRLRTVAHVNRLIDPLWDPLHTSLARPLSGADLRGLRALAGDLSRLGEQLADATKHYSMDR